MPDSADVLGHTLAGIACGLLSLCCGLVLIRWCRRRRFYKKVQRTMDEEELAFQKSLAKNYTEEMAELDESERERLKLLENYMENMGASMGEGEESKDASGDLENVEAFLEQLSKTAAGSSAGADTGAEEGGAGPAESQAPAVRTVAAAPAAAVAEAKPLEEEPVKEKSPAIWKEV